MYHPVRVEIRYLFDRKVQNGFFARIVRYPTMHERLQAMSNELAQAFSATKSDAPAQFLRGALYTAMFYYEQECPQPVPQDIVAEMRQHYFPQYLWLKTVLQWPMHCEHPHIGEEEQGLCAALYECYVQIAAYWAYYRSEDQIAVLADCMLSRAYDYAPHGVEHVCEQLRAPEPWSREGLPHRAIAEIMQEWRKERDQRDIAAMRQRRVAKQN